MVQYNNFESIMETGDHFKTGAGLKSLVSKGNIFRKACFALLAAGVIILSVNAYTGISAHTTGVNAISERWEYRSIDSRNYPSVMLDSYGKDGWELVAVTVSETKPDGEIRGHRYIL